MRWFVCIIAALLAAGLCGPTAAQREATPEELGLIAFISYAPSKDQLLPEEQAAFDFCSKQLKRGVTLVTLDDIAAGKVKLSKYRLVWWHYARDTKLPPAALAQPTIDAFNRYLRRGGNLLLSLQACQYVAPLGLDVAPDQIGWKARADMPAVGLRSTRNHSIFGVMSERFLLCQSGTLQPATFARWVNVQPKNGRLLAHTVLDGEDKETYRCIYEWALDESRVIAVGEYGFRFTGPDGNQAGINLQFAYNIINYLTTPASFHITLRPKGKKVSSSHIGYLSRIAAANTLFVERGTTVEVEFTCTPRQEQTATLGVAVCTVDEEKSMYEVKDWIITKEFSLRPGREIHEKGRFSTAMKPGLYYVIAVIGYNNIFHQYPDYAQRIYVVRPTETGATLSDKALVYTIETDQWLVELEKVTGAIKGLTHKRYPGLNFAANEFNSPLTESKNQVLLGDFFVTSRKPRSQWLEEGSIYSTDVRAVDMEGDKLLTKFLDPSSKLGGFNNVRCVSALSFNKPLNCIEWQLTVRNATLGPLEVGDVYVPLAFNTAYNHRLSSPDEIVKGRLIMRPDICGASSYVVLETRAGDPPYLVLVPTPGTPIECLAHDQKSNKSAGRDWEGLPYLYMYSKASKEIENWGGWFNGHRSFTLGQGESRTFGLRMFWADNYNEIDSVLYNQGRLVSHLSPGYVVPANMPATLQLRCALGVGGLAADKGTKIERISQNADAYRLTFSRPGRHTIRVGHGRGETTYLHVYSLPSLAETAAARAAFILEHQQFKAPEDRRYLAFGMWDSEDQRLVDKSETKELAGGSTVVGIGPPLFLAAKNTVYPDADEIKALEEYIEHELHGRIQDTNTYAVHTFVDPAGDGPTTDSYVYPHVFNLYFAMYRIGTRYGLTRVPAVNYLKLAQRTAMAYLGQDMPSHANMVLGNPGEGTLGLILRALLREGLSSEAAQLQEAMGNKVNTVAKYPFLVGGVFTGGRIWPADTTGLSGNYWLSRVSNWQDGLLRALKMLVATRGNGRHWMWYGNDLAWDGELAKYPTLDATTLNHPSAYNAAALLDAAVLWRNASYTELGYAGLLGPWARVRPTGEPEGFFAWEPKLDRFDPYSGDVDAALAPTFFYLGTYVAIDRIFGLVAYGGQVTSDKTTYTVVPADDMGKRVVSVPHQLVFEVGADHITKVTVTKTADRMDVEIARGWAEDHDGEFSVSGLAAGTWSVSVDGGQPQQLSSEQLAGGLRLPFREGREDVRLTIAKHAAAAH
jgi:hypothetical protein